MRDTTGQEQPKKRGRPPSDGPELRVVGVNVNPAPDAQDRLRRLFTILARLAEDDGHTFRAGQDSLAVRAPREDSDEQGE